jgi:hypothetical protein
MQPDQWEIFHSDKLDHYIECICGHHVKRVSYLYNIDTKEILCIGTTCAKKYGITRHIKNRILIQILKEDVQKGDLVNRVPQWIQNTYFDFREKINSTSKNDLDYYDIVAPFQRLLNDVCELVTEYKYDLILLLKSIEQDVESMNECVRHYIIDEYKDDVISETSLSTIEDDEVCQDTDTQSIIDSEISLNSTPLRIEYVKSNSSFIFADESHISNENWCKIIEEYIVKDNSMNESLEKTDEDIEFRMDDVDDLENVHNEETHDENEESEPLELSADTPSELSDDNINSFFHEKENDSIKSEYSAETPIEENTHRSFHEKENDSIKSEYSAEIPVEEKIKSSYPFITLGDSFCDNYICNPVSNQYCIITWGMRNLHTQIDSLQKEVNYLRKNVNDNADVMRKNKIDAENLVVYSKEILKSMQTQLEKKYSWNK